MYRDETKNLIDSLDWSKFNNFSYQINASMSDEETCKVVANTIDAIIRQSTISGTAFMYFVNVGFANSYQNELGLSNSRKFRISVRDVVNSNNGVRYSAYPISGVIDDNDTYSYKIWVRVDMTLQEISINSDSLMPPSVLSNLKTWWVLLPSVKNQILN